MVENNYDIQELVSESAVAVIEIILDDPGQVNRNGDMEVSDELRLLLDTPPQELLNQNKEAFENFYKNKKPGT